MFITISVCCLKHAHFSSLYITSGKDVLPIPLCFGSHPLLSLHDLILLSSIYNFFSQLLLGINIGICSFLISNNSPSIPYYPTAITHIFQFTSIVIFKGIISILFPFFSFLFHIHNITCKHGSLLYLKCYSLLFSLNISLRQY